MKTIRKVMAMLTAMVLMTILCAANVSAASVFDNASSVEGGKKYSFKLSSNCKSKCFVIDVEEKTDLVFQVETDAKWSYVKLYNSKYSEIDIDERDVTAGKYVSYNDRVEVDGNTGKNICKYSCEVNKGRYYIYVTHLYDNILGTSMAKYSYGKYSLSVLSPQSGNSESKASDKSEKSANTVKLTLNKGDKLGLGAMTGDKAVSSAKWSSSDDKVAKVDSKGNVTAVGAGSCRITWKTKSAEFSVYIEVVSAKKSK